MVDDPAGEWLNVNTVHSALPLRISTDNTATGNWHNASKVGGLWTNYENDLILDDHLVKGEEWAGGRAGGDGGGGGGEVIFRFWAGNESS